MNTRWFRKCSGPPRSRTLSWRHSTRLTCLTAGVAAFYLGDAEGRLLAWSPTEQAGRLLYDKAEPAPLVHLTADAEHVACAWEDGQVGVWSIARQTLLALDGAAEMGELAALLALPAGWFAWVCRTGRVWTSRGEACQSAGLTVCETVRTAVFAPASGDVVLALEDRRLLFWRPQTPDSKLTSVSVDQPVVLLGAGAHGSVLALDEQDVLWQVTPHGASPVSPCDQPASAVAVLPDGQLASGHRLGWPDEEGPTTAEVVVRDAGGTTRRMSAHTDTVLALVALSDGRLVSAGADGLVHVWDPDRDRLRRVARHDEAVTALAVQQPAGPIASLAGRSVKVWAPAAVPQRSARMRRCLARPWTVVAAGQVILGEETLQIVDEHDNVQRRCAVAVAAGSTGAVVEPSVARFGTGPAGLCWLDNDGGLFFWGLDEAPARAVGWLPDSEQVSAVALLERRQVATGDSDGRVNLHHLAEHPPLSQELSPASEDDPVTALAAARLEDGSLALAAGWSSGLVCLWRAQRIQGRPLELAPHTGRVTALAVLPDGRVASAAEDGCLLLRKPAQQEEPLVYTTEEPIVALAFDTKRWVLVCGLESGAALRLGIEPEFSRCRERTLAGSDTVLLSASEDTTVLNLPSGSARTRAAAIHSPEPVRLPALGSPRMPGHMVRELALTLQRRAAQARGAQLRIRVSVASNEAEPFQLRLSRSSQEQQARLEVQAGQLVQIEVDADQAGYLSVLNFDSAGSLDVLLPGPLGADNQVQPGRSHCLKLQLTPSPAGDHTAIIWTRRPASATSAEQWRQRILGGAIVSPGATCGAAPTHENEADEWAAVIVDLAQPG